MSLALAVGDLWTVRFTFTNVATATAINVLHYRVTAFTGTPPALVSVLALSGQTLYNGFAAHWDDCASDGVTFANARVTSVFPLPRSVGVNYIPPDPISGVNVSQPLPLQDTPTILKRTAVGNRWGLGRVFVVGLPEESQDSGVITPGFATELGELAGWIGSPQTITGVGWTVSLEPVLVRGPEDNPVSITSIISAQLSNLYLKTQRRRRPGKGE